MFNFFKRKDDENSPLLKLVRMFDDYPNKGLFEYNTDKRNTVVMDMDAVELYKEEEDDQQG
jgi:hypothetical protein